MRGIGMSFIALLALHGAAWTEGGAVRGWNARLEPAPGGAMRLLVEGAVDVAGSVRPSLGENRFQGINPAILFLELRIRHGTGAKRSRAVRYERTAGRIAVTEVDIFLDGRMIARIPVRRER